MNDVLLLLEYPEIDWFMEELQEREEKLNAAKKLDMCDTLIMSKVATYKKNTSYVRWRRNLIDILERKKDKTLFDKLRSTKKNTLFDKIKGLKR